MDDKIKIEHKYGFPCRVCNLLKECEAKGEDNRCGGWRAMDKLMFISQQMDYFIIKNPIRRWLYRIYQKHAVIKTEKYKRITGRDFMFAKDPFPEWGSENQDDILDGKGIIKE